MMMLLLCGWWAGARLSVWWWLLVQVRELLHKRVRDTFLHPQFNSDVMKPLSIEALLDQEVRNLSGGELQRVALVLALGTPADIYLIDEPSAYLDSEQRIIAAKVLPPPPCPARSPLHCALLLRAVWLTSSGCDMKACWYGHQVVVRMLAQQRHALHASLRRSSSASSCTPRRRRSSWSTTSSWPPTWPTASSCTRASPPRTPLRAPRRVCSQVLNTSPSLVLSWSLVRTWHDKPAMHHCGLVSVLAAIPQTLRCQYAHRS